MSERARYDLKDVWQTRAQQGRRRDMRAARQHSGEIGQASSGRKRVNRFKRRAGFVQNGERRRYDLWKDEVALDGARTKRLEKKRVRPVRIVEAPKSYIICALLGGACDVSERDIEMFAVAETLRTENVAVLALTAGDPQALRAYGVDRVATLETSSALDPSFLNRVEAWANMSNVAQILLPDTVDGRSLARRLAVRLNIEPVIGAHSIGDHGATRRGFADTSDLSFVTPKVITVHAETVARRFPYDGEVRAMEEMVAPSKSQDTGSIRIEREVQLGPDKIALEEARVIFSAGAGVANIDAFISTANDLNAAAGGTRVLCDRGELPRDRQIGASGRAVSADLYVAFGLSGATQHLQGIEKCARVVAINIDAAAPIFQRSDVGILADADKVLAALREGADNGVGS